MLPTSKKAVASPLLSVAEQEAAGNKPSELALPAAEAVRNSEGLRSDDSFSLESFLPSETFAGAKRGYVFRFGELGQGYYADNTTAPVKSLPPIRGVPQGVGGWQAARTSVRGSRKDRISREVSRRHSRDVSRRSSHEDMPSIEEEAVRQQRRPKPPTALCLHLSLSLALSLPLSL